MRRAHMLRGARMVESACGMTRAQRYLTHIPRKRSRPIDGIGSGDQSRAETEESDLEWLALA